MSDLHVSAADRLAFIDLFTLIGACLLFVYGLPRKKFENVIISGETAMKHAPEPNERDVSESEWQPNANRFQRRPKLLNSTGFALVAAGTLLQMAAIYVPAQQMDLGCTSGSRKNPSIE